MAQGNTAPDDEARLWRSDCIVQARSRRVVILVVLLWILNALDLGLTIIADRLGHFDEANPVARPMMEHEHPYRITAFKVGLVAFASSVLLVFRRQRVVEQACWGLCAVYLALTLRWMLYFNRAVHIFEQGH